MENNINTKVIIPKTIEAYRKLNKGSHELITDIIEEINFFNNSFRPKIYPINSSLDVFTHRSMSLNLTKKWAEKWLEIVPDFIGMIIEDLIPKTKKLLSNFVEFDQDLILATIETEAIYMFKEFITKNLNDVQIYKMINSLEKEIKLLASEKIEREINYHPFQFTIISGFVYSIYFEGRNPIVNVNTQTKILKFNNLDNITNDDEIKKEIKQKLKDVIDC
jgi:hypothetical protein